MKPLKILQTWLNKTTTQESGLYVFSDFKALFPHLTDSTLKTLLSRSVKAGLLLKICRGVYLHRQAEMNGLLLYHVANLLRADKFNYISLESALSEYGVISQIPINWLTIMSSGRSNIIKCGIYGTIEIIHTTQKPTDIASELIYDDRYKMWKASVKLALRDMRIARRNLDLIDESTLNEFI